MEKTLQSKIQEVEIALKNMKPDDPAASDLRKRYRELKEQIDLQ